MKHLHYWGQFRYKKSFAHNCIS